VAEQYKVRWFREDDIPYFIQGLNVDLWDEYTEDVFKWKFRDDPYNLGFTPIAVVENKPTGKPVAFNSFLPIQVRCLDTVFTAVQGCDGFVDREHRRRGLFQMTLRFLAQELKGGPPELLLGFNLIEAAGAAHKAGSEYTYDVLKCVIEEPQIRHFQSESNFDLEQIRVEEYHERYEEWASRIEVFHIHRSMPYLRWRIKKNPVRNYTAYRVIDSGKDVGYIVIDLFKENGGITMTLADYTPGLLEKQLPIIISELSHLHPDVTRVEFNAKMGCELHLKATDCLFASTPLYKVIMMAIHNSRQISGSVYRDGVEVSDVNRWHITNSDIF
jgi:hypothetical protein